jgi:Zn-dependent protease with chaperone function
MAILLTIGFYTLAIAVAVALLAIPYGEWVAFHRVTVRVLVFTVLVAGTIIWSILPRPASFEAPGPRLRKEEQPRLFQHLEEVAALVGERQPAEVYLVPEVNAGVLQAGGLLGLGGHRVMILGLPLLKVLRVSELRAVLAHEYGHYSGGDTALGPLVYQTRDAIMRTVANVSGRSSVMRLPFVWYAKAFLRISQAVSRAQEFAADRRAAMVIGARALSDGLRAVEGAAMAYAAYFRQEFVPVLEHGFAAPYTAGFAAFLAQPSIAGQVDQAVSESLANPKADPYDSHPPLAERIAAVSDLPPGPDPAGEGYSIELLDGLDQLEPLVVGSLLRPGLPPLTQIGWERVGESVFLPDWKKVADEARQGLAGLTAGALSSAVSNAPAYGAWTPAGRSHRLAPEELRRAGLYLLGCALAVKLCEQGWAVEALPGEQVQLRRGDSVLEPFEVVAQLAGGKLSAADWQSQAEGAGIGGLVLG